MCCSVMLKTLFFLLPTGAKFDLKPAMQTGNFITVFFFFSASTQFFSPLHPINKKRTVVLPPRLRSAFTLTRSVAAVLCGEETRDIRWSVCLNLLHSLLHYGLLMLADKSRRG